MRAALLVALVTAACTPDIAPGTYFCGAEGLCPEGQACNGPDNICVLDNQAQPFDCDGADPTGDDAPSAGQPLGDLGCVSQLTENKGCLRENDPADWFQLDVPDNCNAVQIDARVTFPVAFEPVEMQVSSENGAPTTAETPCSSGTFPLEGQTIRCFKLTVQNGSHHAIGLVHQGSENCNGACSNNRYILSLQLSTP